MIRQADISDLSGIIECARGMHNESVFALLPFDSEKLASGFIDFIDNHICVVFDDGGIKGFLLAACACPWYMPDAYYIVSEELLYVSPEYRGSGVASEMITDLCSIAVSMNVKEVRINTATGAKQESFDTMATSLGFTKFGAEYRKGV